MKAYLDLMKDVVDNGMDRGDRTGVGTRSVFGRQIRFDLQDGFPLVTTKKVHLRSIIQELLWFLQGSTDNNWLKERNVSIWNEWALENGDLGPIYGKQWRSWQCPDGSTVDQISEVIEQIRNKPNSRRLIVSAWNPAELPDESIGPQDNVRQGSRMNPLDPRTTSARGAWLWLRATACSSSTLPTANFPVSFTSAVRICFWGCRSISRPTHC